MVTKIKKNTETSKRMTIFSCVYDNYRGAMSYARRAMSYERRA